jgi:hypothetical protein
MNTGKPCRFVSFYHKETGAFSGVHLTASTEKIVALNTPADHVAIDGHHDPLAKRVDVSTGQIVDYVPPQPSADHEWNDAVKRWQLSATYLQAQGERICAQREIESLERAQHRPLRELCLDPANVFARQQLRAIDDKIKALRPALKLNG